MRIFLTYTSHGHKLRVSAACFAGLTHRVLREATCSPVPAALAQAVHGSPFGLTLRVGFREASFRATDFHELRQDFSPTEQIRQKRNSCPLSVDLLQKSPGFFVEAAPTPPKDGHGSPSRRNFHHKLALMQEV